MSALQRYDRPGNERELENAIERLVVGDDDYYIGPNNIKSINRRNCTKQ